MKKLILGLGLLGMMVSSTFAQGLVSISLSNGNLVYTNTINGTTGKVYGNYRYELLISTNLSTPPAATDLLNHPEYLSYWVDSGVSGTAGLTTLNAGKIIAPATSTVNGLPAPSDHYDNPFVMTIVGWSTDMGSNWSAVANQLQSHSISSGYFGTTPIAINFAGGGPSSLPAINLWGNQTGTPGYGINSGLVLNFANSLAYDFAIWQQPTNQTIPLGGTGVVSVGADGAPMSFQWWFNSATIPGATNSYYQITNMSPANIGDYYVVMTNLVRSQTSAVAHVSIQSSPSISQSPTNGQVLPVGTTANLTVVAAGDAPLSYQWRSTTGPATLGTAATLSFPLAQTNNSGSYFVIITNTFGAVTSSPASLTIYQAAAIVTPPVSQTLPYGAPATFSVVASGFPTLSYQWLLNGTNLAAATTSSLTIGSIKLKDLGDYSVLVSNAYSSVQSIPATLSMSPSIINPFTGAVGLWGQGATLTVGAVGSGTLAYQWYKDGVAIDGATNASYNLPTLQLTDAGQYTVTVSSGFGSTTNLAAQVVVNPAAVSLGIYAGVTVQGTVGYSYDIQYSTDLSNTNAWIDTTNITLQQPVQIWIDYGSDARINPKRYYRVKALP